MGALVSYRLAEAGDPVALVTMDDGKVNVLSSAMQGELHAALDRAAADAAVVVLAGREGVFSAGFDLRALSAGGADAVDMVTGGFELAARLLAFPSPVVVACTGHAVAMGAFLLLSGDYRVGADGPFRVTANEVAIGLTLPAAAAEVMRQRLTPAAFNRAALLAEVFDPGEAVAAGFLDRLVEPGRVVAEARARAEMLTLLDRSAHASTKLRTRHASLESLRRAIDADKAELAPV
jgi:enoyl-CoA hydratase